jgi:hypothetical protein
MTHAIIYKRWNETPQRLKEENEPTGWFEVSEDECLDKTEGSGYYAPGSVIESLEKGLQVRTPSAFYKMEIQE